ILCFSVAFSSLFFYYSTATSHTYTLSLHDALPILTTAHTCVDPRIFRLPIFSRESWLGSGVPGYLILLWGELIAPFFISLGELRSEEHTSELQSRSDLVCRLLLEKKKKKNK